MKNKTKNTTTNKTSHSVAAKRKSFAVGTHGGQVFASVPYTTADFKNSLLLVSLLINLFVFTTWLVIQVSQEYAVVAAQSLIN